MRSSAFIFLILICLAQLATAGPLTFGFCMAACTSMVTACYTAAGFTFGMVPLSVLGASPALMACTATFWKCQTACGASLFLPIP